MNQGGMQKSERIGKGFVLRGGGRREVECDRKACRSQKELEKVLY